MFRLMGSDGKEYGPITTDQLRQWIREGRAGGLTQVRREGESEWSALRSVAEFADVFQIPPTLGAGNLPRGVPNVVRLFAFGLFIAAGISTLFWLFSVFTILRFASNGTFHPGATYFFSWGLALLALPIRVVSGVGLLRGREWARKLAVVFAAAMALYGGWGMTQNFSLLARHGDLTVILRSPSFVLSNLWSVALLVFNIATVIVLSRRAVRAAFAASPHPA